MGEPRGFHKPKPFQRPGVTLSSSTMGVKKEWRTKTAELVLIDDIVQGHNRGLVVQIDQAGGRVGLHFQNGSMEWLDPNEPLTVFTEVSRGFGH